MKNILIALFMIPALSFSQWALDFDDDWAGTIASGVPYQVVAYIETDGSSSLETGINSSDDLEVRLRFYCLRFITAYRPVFANYLSEKSNAFRLIQGVNSSGWHISANTRASGSQLISAAYLPYQSWNTFTLKRWEYSINGTTNSVTMQTVGTEFNGPIRIAISNMECRYAYFKMLKGGIVVFDGVPVVAPDGQGALYDLVSKRLIENSGGGTITWSLSE